jgi:hypothetical protein
MKMVFDGSEEGGGLSMVEVAFNGLCDRQRGGGAKRLGGMQQLNQGRVCRGQAGSG